MSFKTYLQANARKLDFHLFEYLFEGADAQPVLDELRAYQNADGGFGNALEPDVRLPDSSPLATVVAFQYLAKVGVDDDELVDKAIGYLVKTYDNSRQCWVNLPPQANKYPRAPWWNYEEVLEWAGWGNPSAEILGYLLHYAGTVDDPSFLAKVSEQAVQRLHHITEPEQHEVKCYIRLYERAGEELKAKLYSPLARHITQLVKINPKDWQGYVATPLTFVDSPDSPFAGLFDKQVLLDNAEYVRSQLMEGNHWEPAWQWGQFEHEWAQAKQEWSGKLTVENLEMLRAFGVGV